MLFDLLVDATVLSRGILEQDVLTHQAARDDRRSSCQMSLSALIAGVQPNCSIPMLGSGPLFWGSQDVFGVYMYMSVTLRLSE